MLPRWGWRSVFYAGGVLPLAVALALIWMLPESLRFLGMRGTNRQGADKIVALIAPELTSYNFDSPAARNTQPSNGFPVINLFTAGRAWGTVLLWVPFFMNLLLLYFIVNWLPALLRQAHMPTIAGIVAISLFSLGGIIGSILQGYLMNAYGRRLVLLIEFLLCIGLVSSLAFIRSFPLMMTAVFATILVGVFSLCLQFGEV